MTNFEFKTYLWLYHLIEIAMEKGKEGKVFSQDLFIEILTEANAKTI